MNSLGNISAHYDLGNEMFKAFLDETMTYSCPIWEREDESLESAQMRKLHSILKYANIKPGQYILEIGTGQFLLISWGSLAITAARSYGCNVTSITLSKEQQALAQERIKQAGLDDKIQVVLQDYRALDPTVKYDHIVSIEMLEAVGPEYLSTFFQKCESVLKPMGNLVVQVEFVNQVITMPESRYEEYCNKVDFIQKHRPLMAAIVEASGKLEIDGMINIGPHYAKALRIWSERFMEKFDSFSVESGRQDIYDDAFKRKWEFYFAYCRVGFAMRTLGTRQIRFTRCNNEALLDAIPM